MEALLQGLCAKGLLPIGEARLRPLTEGAAEDKVDDGPGRALVVDPKDRPIGVLFLARPAAPGLVARSVRMAAACAELDAELGRVILSPLASGDHEGLSFACWPWCRPLSQSRYLGFVQGRRLTPSILSWLRVLMERSKVEDTGQAPQWSHALNLCRLADDDGFPQAMRDLARKGADRLADGAWQPHFVFEHADFWMGNVLWPHRDRGSMARLEKYPFTLIDWAGADQGGYPIVDLVRFAGSSRTSPARLSKELQRHAEVLGCSFEETPYPVLASLGHLGANLEHLPRERYLDLGNKMYRTIHAAL
jgi:hypothetical protein